MSDFRLRAEACLGAGAPPRSFGSLVHITERSPVFALEIAGFGAPNDGDVAHFQAALGAAPPAPGAVARGPAAEVLSVGPNRWIAIADTPMHFPPSENFAVTDLSSARGCFLLSGAKASTVLAKGTSVDLDPTVFTAGSVIVTRIGHFSAVVWRPSDGDGFAVLVSRSYARSFYDWVILASAEFG